MLVDSAATETAGAALAPLVRVGDVIALDGPLGAGKTSLARGLLGGLGLDEEVPSPTFPILLPYDPPAVRVAVVHADLYRLDGPDEVEALGLDEMLADAALVIEWPDRLGGRLWPHALRLSLGLEAGGGRRLTWYVPPAWEARWPPPGFPHPR